MPDQPTSEAPDDTGGAQPPAEAAKGPMVSDPAKLIRLGTMLQALTAEVRAADTDEESREMLARIHNETVEELSTVLSPDLMEELTEFASCCDDDGVPTEAEIRIAQAQLVGWLQGLLQGIQASMMAQQAAAARQLHEINAARGRPAPAPGLPEQTGQYL